jgi:hypothetical protein
MAVDEERTVRADGAQASPATPTPAVSPSLLASLRDAPFVRYDGRWYDVSVANYENPAPA